MEIHSAELEGLPDQRLVDGQSVNVEGIPAPGTIDYTRRTRAMKAAEGIRKLRSGITLDRPASLSLREYAHLGHKY